MKLKTITIMVLSAIAILSFGCGSDKESNESSAPTTPKVIFKQVGYFKDEQRNRSFCIYTDSKDRKEMIAHARTLAYTEGRQTVAHFFDDEKFTPDNSTQKTFQSGMWLDTPAFSNEYKAHMLGTYQKTLSGDEVWYEKDAATREDGNHTSIK